MANGWGQGTWGAVGWGGIGNTSFAVTGVAGTGEIGDEATSGGSVVIETGLQATSSVGTVTASSVFVITATGVLATTSVNSVLPKIPITAVVTGLSATTGFLSGWGSSEWGVDSWGGGVAVLPGQDIVPTPAVATGSVGTVTVTGTGIFSVSGTVGTSAVGNEVVNAQMKFSATGLSATSAVGNTSEVGSNLVVPTGVSSTILMSGYEASTITKTITVQNVSGDNKYFVDGVQQATQELFEGNTYKFDQSDGSNSGHPLRFSTTSNGTHASGTEYTTGVTTNGTPGSSGAYTQITVADKAPTLYYYCTQHSAMGGTANTPAVYTVLTSTGAPVTTVVGTMALGNESVIGSADIGVTLAGMEISAGNLAMTGSSVLSLTGVSATGFTGPENVYSLIKPDQVANWIERVA